MDLLDTQDVASVILFDLRLSEGELQTFATALEHVLSLSDADIHALFDENDPDIVPSETREFIEDRLAELMDLIQEHCRPEFLPERFRTWKAGKSLEMGVPR